MPPIQESPIYQFQFYFDYGSGGCLWPSNKAAKLQFGAGPADAGIFDHQGNCIQAAALLLPAEILQEIIRLDNEYRNSFDPDYPAKTSMWDEAEWTTFHAQARALHQAISDILGSQYAIIYAV